MKKLALILVAAVAATCSALYADTFPTRPITFVAVFGPGSASDTICRIIADPLGGAFKQPVIVDNRGGVLPGEIISRAPPNGYNLLYASNTFWIGSLLHFVEDTLAPARRPQHNDAVEWVFLFQADGIGGAGPVAQLAPARAAALAEVDLVRHGRLEVGDRRLLRSREAAEGVGAGLPERETAAAQTLGRAACPDAFETVSLGHAKATRTGRRPAR